MAVQTVAEGAAEVATQASGQAMGVADAVGLGVVQGLTEFLPVSSSGHLVLGGELLGLTEPHLFFDVVLHVATLLATVIFYRRYLAEVFVDTWRGLGALRSGQGLRQATDAHEGFLFALWVTLGTIPTGLIGVLFKDPLEALFGAPRFAAGMLLVTAGLLLLSLLAKKNTLGIGQLGPWRVLMIGLIQGFAIIPGISRSGSTIACALLLGVERELAARFSFLLSIPAILGALALKILGGHGHAADLGLVSVGFLAAALTGVLALAVLIPLVRKGRLYLFALYLIPAGIFGLVAL